MEIEEEIPGKSKMKILGKPVRTGKNGVTF
jgi:hypothetical protein